MKILKKIIAVILFILGTKLALVLIPGIFKLLITMGQAETLSLFIGMWAFQLMMLIVNFLIFKIALGLWKNEKMKLR